MRHQHEYITLPCLGQTLNIKGGKETSPRTQAGVSAGTWQKIMSVHARARARTHTHARAHTHARTHARTHTHLALRTAASDWPRRPQRGRDATEYY